MEYLTTTGGDCNAKFCRFPDFPNCGGEMNKKTGEEAVWARVTRKDEEWFEVVTKQVIGGLGPVTP
jgi:hypothetical protein